MRCETVREALSARIDGEPEPVPAETVDRHVAGCTGCRSWYQRAEGLRRATVLQPAPPVPDLTAAIMGQLPPPTHRYHWARVLLGVVAIVQIAQSAAQVFGADTGMGRTPMEFMMGHMTHEFAAWNLAVGIGLAWAALRVRNAGGQLPMLTVFVGVLTGASALDLLRGEVTVGRLVTHIPVLVGVALLYLVHRTHRDDDQPLPGQAPGPGEGIDDTVDAPESAPRQLRSAWGSQRPASRHRAA